MAALTLIAALSGCAGGAPSPAAAKSPATVPASATPTDSPSGVASSARTVGRVVDSAGLHCRLPVLIQGVPQYGWTGGFVTFPSGPYEPDPSGVITEVGDGDIGTQTQPYLNGHAGGTPFYDLSRKRWLPVGPGLTSPDGSSYAYVAPGLPATEYFVSATTVASGADRYWNIRPPASGVGVGWQAADFDGRYIYLVAQQINQFPAGVWRFDTRTASMQQLLSTSAGHVLLVQNGVAWIGLINPADPSPPVTGKGEAFDTLESINIFTGARITWMYRPGHSVIFWGLDSSAHPVVMVRPSPDSGAVLPLTLVDVPGGNGSIAIPAGFLPQGAMEADNGRLWFGSAQGIYLWTPATGLRKVFEFLPDSAQEQEILPAGYCV